MTATPAPARTRPRRAADPHVRSVLPNGLRVVTQSMPGARSASVAIFVPVGSRHEDEAHAGLSHLLEHLVFKGTRDHPEPGALSQVVEGVGGSINASTDRELTDADAAVPSGSRPLPRNAEELARDLRFIQMELLMSADADSADGDRSDEDEDGA